MSTETPKMFPIMHAPYIPWEVIAPFEHQAQKNHYQSIKRLAERGGLDPTEAVAVLEQRPYRRMEMDAARARLREIVDAHENSELSVAIRELTTLRAAADALASDVENMRDVKGRHNSGVAYDRLMIQLIAYRNLTTKP